MSLNSWALGRCHCLHQYPKASTTTPLACGLGSESIAHCRKVPKSSLVKVKTSGFTWVLPEDYCKKDPCIFNTKVFVSKVGNPCPPLCQLLASRILYALFVGEEQYEISRARFCTQSCSKVGQLLVNSSPTGKLQGLPCNSPLATLDSHSCLKHHPIPEMTNCL